jgi:hypothetical protein
MKLTTKKIIAREFIILTLILTVVLFSFLCTYPYNAFKRYQVQNILTEISKKRDKADALSSSFINKLNQRKWFFEKFSNQWDVSAFELNTSDKMWNRLDFLALNDSIKYKWNYVWDKEIVAFNKEIGFSNPDDFQSFIDKNRLTKVDSLNYDSFLAINSEITILDKNKMEHESETLSYIERTDFGLKVLVICFIFLFVFRYIFYSLKWSLKILKQNSE